ncbi:MAG TPA: histidine ammonia-lyase [Ktedonobacterales bacterium]|jgi:histidine ammonia-lyase|nr:histidine ammonia-lyase [Ktedonobacterales bacterium]
MVELTGKHLESSEVVTVARDGAPVAPYAPAVVARMERSRAWIAQTIARDSEAVYGVNTGFGSLAHTRIAPDQARQLSRNLILTCLVGVGEPLPIDVVRAMMVLRANMFARGHSGIRPHVAQLLIDMLNRGVTPWVPAKGSLGASGDLAPLAHIAVVLTRDESASGGYSGQAYFEGELMSGAAAMERAGLQRVVAEAKEGLALTNGTALMVAMGTLAVHDALALVQHAETAAALSYEALCGRSAALHPALHAANGQPGQITIAFSLRRKLQGSQLIDSDPTRVQDAYSLRCTPQVLGAALDTIEFLTKRFEAAINASSDNPLIFTEDGDTDGGEPFAISGGNFHGQGPSMWLDFLGIALCAVGNIAERRIFRLVTPELSNGLPAMLARHSGLDSGLMMAQYTAAALVSDNKTLAHPDSVDSIPSCANQEDHVSMGANAARHTAEIITNIQHIIAIELLTAAQAIDLRPSGPARLGWGTRREYAMVREHVAFMEHDRETTPDIERLVALIRTQQLLMAEWQPRPEEGNTP